MSFISSREGNVIDDDVKLGPNVRIFNAELVNIFGCEIGKPRCPGSKDNKRT